MNKLFFKRTVSISLVVLWAVIIFLFSSQSAQQSSDVSGGIVEKIISTIYPDFDKLPTSNAVKVNDIVTVIVRKSAHFLEYFILGFLSVNALFSFQKFKLLTCGAFSTVFCVLYSISDEIHQYFVPGRACRFLDICIDSLGAIAAILLLVFIKYKKSEKSGEVNAKEKVD